MKMKCIGMLFVAFLSLDVSTKDVWPDGTPVPDGLVRDALVHGKFHIQEYKNRRQDGILIPF